MFDQTFLPAPRRGTQGASFAASISAQFLLVGTALLVPLYFTEALPMARLDARLFAPPMPKPIAVQLVEVPQSLANAFRPVFQARIYAPRTIPLNVSQIVDLPGPLEIGPPAQFGPGLQGVGPTGFSDTGRIADIPDPPPDKPVAVTPPKASGPVKVSAGVQLAMLVKRVMPVYPPLAKQARIQGTVRLVGVISRDGRIINLQVLSGHPLLVGAAVDAVKQWIYKPTLLNGEPVEVIAPIDVNFTLTQ